MLPNMATFRLNVHTAELVKTDEKNGRLANLPTAVLGLLLERTVRYPSGMR